MKKVAQMTLPDGLFHHLKDVARQYDISPEELMRRFLRLGFLVAMVEQSSYDGIGMKLLVDGDFQPCTLSNPLAPIRQAGV